MTTHIACLNAGSSSVKLAGFAEREPTCVLREAFDTSGMEAAAAAAAAVDRLGAQAGDGITAIAHRIVHGGARLVEHAPITDSVLAELRVAAALDPDHLPLALALIEAATRAFPRATQVACFDTAFHRHLPAPARLLPIPRRYARAGVHRFGFHGLSFASVLERLARVEPAMARGKLVIAHLGSGSSLAAIDGGKRIDTTMGFTPAGGVVMGTRCGDIDPGVLVHLARTENLRPDQLDELVNRRSGLLGLSERTSDMRELLALAAVDSRANEAVECFCWSVRKAVAAMAASLGGIDALVFTGGIGQGAAAVRERICAPLGFLGIELDQAANAASSDVVSSLSSRAHVRIVAADEELMMARIARRLLADAAPAHDGDTA